ncbi:MULTISPECIES: hypothetical protein [Alcaligenaceae]|uniref:DNA-damage-inducible protein J n=2 Tax=Alcaligenaceae TaxID=506 RepID=A0A4R3VA87_9BURK|nr:MULTISPECIES: hypothetical protein [Alcaligenaceae]MCX5564302.1 hypothetical protein [Alcaligenes phenolicus]TCV00472.1 DNA-damage-inducible protein J [Paracandidimonas soli]
MPVVTVSARVTAAVKAEAAVVAEAHGMSMAALVRELLIRVAAGDKETLAWLDEARR